ncbi:MAG: nucleotide excision repair endonuclease [Candidatus Eisenbacteria bacterium]
MSEELIARIAALAEEQGGTVEAEAIARDFLRLAAPGSKAAAGLVRALLGRDHHFIEEQHGCWRYRSAGSALEPPVLLVDLVIPPGTDREPWQWLLQATLWEKRSPLWRHRGTASSPALEELLALLPDVPVATERPGSFTRWLGVQERLHARPEIEPVMIDLAGWRRLLDANECVTRASLTPIEGQRRSTPATETVAMDIRLKYLAGELDRVIEVARRRGLRSWREVARVPAEAWKAAEEELWAAERSFTVEDIENLPEEPGIYRFFDREGNILYVGKSANLRRRVRSYFRPLTAGSGRRGQLLERLYRFDIETTGNELEALIRELEEIRRRRPVWNVQIDLGVEETDFPPGECDVLLLLPTLQGSHALYALAGARAARAAPGAALSRAGLEESLHAFFAGAPCAALCEIPAPERVLVRRWLQRDTAGRAILRRADFSSVPSMAQALLRAMAGEQAAESPASDERLILRDGEVP